MTTTPRSSGYLDVNGLHQYYETYGSGAPIVLLHGGVLSIDLNYAELIPALADRYLLIATEMQGHGRTADIDREITPEHLASDVVGLLDHLGIDRAHVIGHSYGATVAIELAVSHPTRVASIVPISASVRPDGLHPDLLDPSLFGSSDRLPTAADFELMTQTYQRLSPTPENFQTFFGKMSSSAGGLSGWSDEQLAAISAPVLFVIGDHDFVTVEHGAQVLELIPGSQLAVLPGTNHMQATGRTGVLVPLISDFLN